MHHLKDSIGERRTVGVDALQEVHKLRNGRGSLEVLLDECGVLGHRVLRELRGERVKFLLELHDGAVIPLLAWTLRRARRDL